MFQKPSNRKPKKELFAAVLDVLRGWGHPMKTIDLAHRLNMRTTAAVNPTLYLMQREHLISRINISPPTWSISMEQSTSETNLNAPNRSKNQVPITGGRLPIESTSLNNSSRQMMDFTSEDGAGCNYASSDASSDISSIDTSDISSVPINEVLSVPNNYTWNVPSIDALNVPNNDILIVPSTGVISATGGVLLSGKRPSRTCTFGFDNSGIQDCNTNDVSSDDACLDITTSFNYTKSGLVSESSHVASDNELVTSLSESSRFDTCAPLDDTLDPDVIVEGSDVDELWQDEQGAGCNSNTDHVLWNEIHDQHDTRLELSRKNVLSVLLSFSFASATCEQVASELWCSYENVEAVLRELEALKFASKIGNSTVWVLTVEGERALKSIDGEFSEMHGDKPPSPKTLRKASALLCDVPTSTYLRSRGRGMTANAILTRPGPQASISNGSMHSEEGARDMLTCTVSNTSNTSQKPSKTAEFSYGNVETGAFKPPPTPCELLGIQLKQTTISPLSFAPTTSQGLLLAVSSTNNTTGFSHSKLAISQPAGLPVCGASNIPSSISPEINVESFAVLNKNPISALMEYAQSRHQEARITVENQKGPAHKPT